MTENQEDIMYQAFLRDRRRIIIVFALVVALVIGTFGVGWALSASGRDAWRDQAMTWQERYVQLYDEFTVETGEEPSAPEPAEVAKNAPDPVPGPPGPVGPRGADGRSIIGPTGPTGAPGADSIIPGPAGKDGKDGKDGAPSTVPGPAGAPGPAGQDGKDSNTPGPQGVGIRSIECMEDGTWRFVMSDATQIDVPGPCRTPTINPDKE